jgi:hypothetical protein
MRDADVTFSNKQALAIPSGADLSATDSTTEPTVYAHAPAGGWNVKAIVKNVDTTHPMTDGDFQIEAQVSLDNGSTFKTLDGARASIPAARLAVGEQMQVNFKFGRDFYNELGVAPSASVDMKLVYSTVGHTDANICDVEVTAYIDDGGPGVGS